MVRSRVELFSAARSGVARSGMEWHCVMRNRVALNGVALYYLQWHCEEWSGIAWSGMNCVE